MNQHNGLIPIIDNTSNISEEVLSVLKSNGICNVKIGKQLRNDLEKIKNAAVDFFHQPDEYKKRYPFTDGDGYINQAENSIYYIQRYIFRKNLCPEPFLDIEQRISNVKNFFRAEIMQPIINAIFSSLKLERHLPTILNEMDQTLSLIFYPETTSEKTRLKAHKDTVMITTLWAPQPGLEARVNDEWKSIETPPGYVNVQLGKALELMTDGICHAIEHRVSIDTARERFSIASFMGLHSETPLINYKTNEILNQKYGDYVKQDVDAVYPEKNKHIRKKFDE